MVKGVNKTVIEINDTQSDIFEKVVLYVRPQYSALKQKDLEREANVLIKNYTFEDYDFLPSQSAPRSKRLLFVLFGAILLAAIATLYFIF